MFCSSSSNPGTTHEQALLHKRWGRCVECFGLCHVTWRVTLSNFVLCVSLVQKVKLNVSVRDIWRMKKPGTAHIFCALVSGVNVIQLSPHTHAHTHSVFNVQQSLSRVRTSREDGEEGGGLALFTVSCSSEMRDQSMLHQQRSNRTGVFISCVWGDDGSEHVVGSGYLRAQPKVNSSESF